ncbi:hypothetical protein CBM2626_A20026 [Cupriavidus taiwanensis]|nr:hypothetical protein CBM2626_A20026 [Cupriavidus taiwanensis]
MGAYPARAGRARRQYLRHRAGAEHAPAHLAAQARQAACITLTALKDPSNAKGRARARPFAWRGVTPPYKRSWT